MTKVILLTLVAIALLGFYLWAASALINHGRHSCEQVHSSATCTYSLR